MQIYCTEEIVVQKCYFFKKLLGIVQKEVLQYGKHSSDHTVVTDVLYLLPNAHLLWQNVTLYICLKGEILFPAEIQ